MGKESQTARDGLVFVYNADSGVFNALADVAHKIFSPQTYACNLCALTHTPLGMRGEWRRFLDGLGRPLEFLHADELRARYGVSGVRLPAVFRREGERLEMLAGSGAVKACRTLDDLKRLVLDVCAGEGGSAMTEDGPLGNLTWDEGHQEGRGIMTLADGKIAEFTVDAIDGSITEAARNTIKFLTANEPLISHKIAASMTELYKEWSDGATVTPEELAQRITLTDVSFWEEGGGELYYDAGDIFAGHCICASIDANGEIDEPRLEG